MKRRIRAGVVPRTLGDVALRGGLSRRVIRRTPVHRSAVGHIEVRSPNGNVVGRTTQTVHCQSIGGSNDVSGIASGRARVSTGNHYGNSLRGGLLPQIVVEGITGGAEEELALTIAVAHNRGQIVVDHVNGGEISSLHDLGACGDDIIDGRAFGHGRGPLGIDVRFTFLGPDTGAGSVVDDVEILRSSGSIGIADGKIEELSEVKRSRQG